jgi:hypothetical protein
MWHSTKNLSEKAEKILAQEGQVHWASSLEEIRKSRLAYEAHPWASSIRRSEKRGV